MRYIISLLLLCGFAFSVLYDTEACPVPDDPPVCLGPVCAAQYVHGAGAKWSINFTYINDGQALDYYCNECDGCSLNVHWVFSGDPGDQHQVVRSTQTVADPPDGATGFGRFPTTNVCDGVGGLDTYNEWTNGVKTVAHGHLDCPCIPE